MERYRIVAGVELYYVTFTVVEWLPVFIDETACKTITDSFNFCIQNKPLRVNAYVIMPTHLHAILFDVEFNAERLKRTLDDMRKFTGRQLLDYSARHFPKCFTEAFQEHAGKDRERRFWHYFGEVLETEDGLPALQSLSQGIGALPGKLAIFLRAVLADAGEKRCGIVGCGMG